MIQLTRTVTETQEAYWSHTAFHFLSTEWHQPKTSKLSFISQIKMCHIAQL
jgi:hypothetical protein